MVWDTRNMIRIEAGGARLEGRCIGPEPERAPTIIMLHEGLGSLELWKDFPQKLADATGHGVFAYSRQGYGRSDAVPLPRPLNYMTREALDVLPDVLQAIGFQKGILLGHSDGASIAAIYAGSIQDHRIRGLILMAPHFFTEPSGLQSIADAKAAYENGDLRQRLAKYHDDVDGAFWGWNRAWLDPAFAAWNIEEVIAYIRVPVLGIQGADDQYGTYAQIAALEDGLYAPLDLEIFTDCRHAPFIDQPQRTLTAIRAYVQRLEEIEATKMEVA